MPDTATPQPPRIEALVVRDPAGGATIDVWIDGIRVRDRDLWVTTVDAGRGHDYDSWIAERDLSVAHASPAAGRAIQAAYDDPPGAEYIDDFPPSGSL